MLLICEQLLLVGFFSEQLGSRRRSRHNHVVVLAEECTIVSAVDPSTAQNVEIVLSRGGS